MHDRRVLLKLLELQDLPTLPVIVDKILQMTKDDRSSASDLTVLLERDHAISARLLRLANSAFYGLPNSVASVRQAVVVLGFNETRYLALATSVFDAVIKRNQSAFDPLDFWMHSFGAAKAAQILSEEYCHEGNKEEWFAAGLLHDIGKYVLAVTLKAEYKDIVEEARATGKPLADIELDRLGITHGRAGQWLMEKWRLPAVIGSVSAHAFHARTYAGADREIVLAVAIGNLLSITAGFGSAGDSEEVKPDAALLAMLNMPREDWEKSLGKLSLVRDETRQFLEAL
ncbi:MAG: HDOD domain-containing protein [Candidatus Hydrogenedentes bacterium]|nr:HDOD domain-containing protein [Candidatus Hydrogenedentota bacterium]